MKKAMSFLLAGVMVLSLVACGGQSETNDGGAASVSAEASGEASVAASGEQKPETITVTSLNGSKEEIEVEVPYDPQRVAILDFAVLDAIDNLGLGDRVVGTASTTLDYLMPYTEKEGVTLLGTIKEADLEAVMSCEPDIIFIGGRLSTYYDDLSEIAPVVFLSIDVTEEGVVAGTRRVAETVASIFGLQDEVAEKMAGFDARIEALAAVGEGKTAIVGMCTSGSFNVLGDDGRCSIIGNEIGFTNLSNTITSDESESGSGRGGNSESAGSGEHSGNGRGESGGNSEGRGGSGGGTSTHGNEASFELLVSLAPEYIFVMDRDAAIATDGAQLAQEIMENELVMSTDAYKNGNIVYLAHPNAWYTAEGGITALDYMLSDLESALLQ